MLYEKYTIQEKIAHLEARSVAGLKMADYAALHNINISSFRCWPHQVKKALSVKSSNSIQETSVHATDVVEDEIINSASQKGGEHAFSLLNKSHS